MKQPKFEGKDVQYKTLADNKDIRDLLEKLVPKAKEQMVDFSKQFKGKTEQQTCKNIFDYLMKNFTYVADKEEQIIKLPSALLKKRVGDCKSYSLFTASILENLKIPYTFVYASYNSNPIPGHVYVQTQNGCIIDAVFGTFNKEKKPNFKYKKTMNVRYMSGLGCADCGGTCSTKGVGNIFTDARDSIKAKASQAQATIKTKVQDVKQTVSQGAKTVALAPGRALLMVLINNNFDGIATKLSQGNTATLMNNWYNMGGDRTKLSTALKNGASKPEKKLGFLPKLKAVVSRLGINGIGALSTEQSAGIISLCTAIGTAISGPSGAASGASLGAVIVGILPSITEVLKRTPSTDTGIVSYDLSSQLATEKSNEEANSPGAGKKDNTLLYIGGAALILGGIAYAVKK